MLVLFLGVSALAQPASEETASNFVNFNLNGVNRVRAYLPEYNGEGRTVSIKEFQYDTLDIDFNGRQIPHPRSSGVVSPHSTLMATIIAGGGNSFHTGLGTAWGAHLTSSSFFDIYPDPNSYFQDLDISVQNHSYGIDSIENFYGPVAAAYDLQISQLPQLLQVFSIGNLGAETPVSGPYTGIPAYANMTGEFKTAKNVLTMGVVDSFRIIDPFSSRGPTFDGRIKPELVAFGINGSSAAAALASGAALILQQAYWEEKQELPAAALVKALLINGAADLGADGPDYTYGFGNTDVYQSLQTLLTGHYISDTVEFEQTRQHNLQIPEGVKQLKITLVWNDPPAAINTDKALVNDLDMSLTRIADGRQWSPLVLSTFPHADSLALPARSGEDHVNNVEQIVLEQPEAGNYEIRIDAFDFQVAEQAYHIVYEWDTGSDFRWLFPSRDNQVVPNGSFLEQVYWEFPNDGSQNGALSLSFDGVNWQSLASNVDLSAGTWSWTPPDTVSRALLKMEIGNASYISDTFTISSQSFLQFALNCVDSTGVSWTRHPGIDQYRFYQLGANYMEPFLLTSDTFVILSKNELISPVIAFAPVMPGGKEGIRSFAYDLNQQPENCYIREFTGTIVGESAVLSLSVGSTYNLQTLTLERSESGQFIAKSSINNPVGSRFEFTDPNPDSGINSYRVKLTLSDGTVLYTSIVSLNFILPDQFIIYPNPISRQSDFQVLYNVPDPDRVRFQVYTAQGAQVFSLSLTELQSALFADDFQSGMYFYRFIRDGQLLQSGKLVVR